MVNINIKLLKLLIQRQNKLFIRRNEDVSIYN